MTAKKKQIFKQIDDLSEKLDHLPPGKPLGSTKTGKKLAQETAGLMRKVLLEILGAQGIQL